MDYVDQYALANTADFSQRVGQAMITSARDVQAEDPATPNHTNRSNFARDVLRDPERYQPAFARAVAANVAISEASVDSDLQFTTNSLWDGFSGTI